MSTLETLIRESELLPDQMNRLNHCSAGFWTLQDFYNNWKTSPNQGVYGNAFGIQGKGDPERTPYGLACKAFSLRHCQDFGRQFGFSYSRTGTNKDIIEHQMEKLQRINEPIVFFIPPQITSHPESGKTNEEVKWLVRNATEAPKTHFVFGLHNRLAYPFLLLIAKIR